MTAFAFPPATWQSSRAAFSRMWVGARGRVLVGGAAAIVVLAALLVLVSGGGHSSSPASANTRSNLSRAPLAAATSSSGSDGQTANAIASLLATSATARPQASGALVQVLACRLDPTQGAARLGLAVATRQAVLAGLSGVSGAGLPGGDSLLAELRKAMQDSIGADQGYQSWMSQFGAGVCQPAAKQDPGYAAATRLSNQATADKVAFVTIWNPIAQSLGLHQYRDTDF